MPARRFLSSSIRETLFGIPFDTAALEQFYVLAEEDLALVRSRRKPENRLGLAIHLALLRHPGQGWQEGDWLARQPPIGFKSLDLWLYATHHFSVSAQQLPV